MQIDVDGNSHCYLQGCVVALSIANMCSYTVYCLFKWGSHQLERTKEIATGNAWPTLESFTLYGDYHACFTVSVELISPEQHPF